MLNDSRAVPAKMTIVPRMTLMMPGKPAYIHTVEMPPWVGLPQQKNWVGDEHAFGDVQRDFHRHGSLLGRRLVQTLFLLGAEVDLVVDHLLHADFGGHDRKQDVAQYDEHDEGEP